MSPTQILAGLRAWLAKFAHPAAHWLLPLSLIAGTAASFADPTPPALLATTAFTLIPLAFAALAVKRWPWAALGFLVFAGVALGLALGRQGLAAHVAQTPEAAELDRAYRIEARVLYQWETPFGGALAVDRVRVLSPADAGIKLDRLTLYTPDLAGEAPRHATITTWIGLKRQHQPRTFPWPAQDLRERYIPRLYGTIKSLSLAEFSSPPVEREDSRLNRGARELAALFFERTPSPLWRERLAPFGLGHLLAISGLHCVIVYFILQLLLWPVRRPLLRTMLSIAGILAFAQWAGWTPSVARASLMLVLWRLLPAFNRPRSWVRLWCGLLTISLLAEPLNWLLRGFWYSFAASLGIILGARQADYSPLRHPATARLRPALAIIGAQLFVIPINLTFDSASHLTGFFWNLLGFAALVLLLALLALTLLAMAIPLLTPLANGMEQAIAFALTSLDFQPEALNLIRFPHELWAAFIALAVMAATLKYGPREFRWYATGAILALFLTFNRPLAGDRLTMLDVDQGLCLVYVAENGDAWLFDAGGQLPPGVTLRRAIRLYGAKRVRAAFISHHDADHYNLIADLEPTFPIYGPPSQRTAFAQTPELAPFEFRPLVRGDAMDLGSLRIAALWPLKTLTAPNDNEGSLVLLIRGQNWSLLFTGDAGKWVEPQLGSLPAEGVSALQVGHHGSNTASGSAFLEHCAPDFALISCGRENRFGHPHPKVLQRIKKAAAIPRITAAEGSIHISEDDVFLLEESDGR